MKRRLQDAWTRAITLVGFSLALSSCGQDATAPQLPGSGSATVVLADGRTIEQVEILDPFTNTFVTVDAFAPPSVLVVEGTTVTVRVTASTSGSGMAGAWESTRWETQLGASVPNSACDDGIDVTTPTSLAQHTFTFVAPPSSSFSELQGSATLYTLRLTVFAADGCTSPAGSGADDSSQHTFALQVRRLPDGRVIDRAFLLDPTTNIFEPIVEDPSTFFDVMIPATTSTLTVRVQGSTNALWQSTRWEIYDGAFNQAILATGCDDAIDVNTLTFVAEHTLTFPVPTLAGPHNLRFTAFAADGCTSPADAGANEAQQFQRAFLLNAITALEMLDPASGTFVPLGGSVIPTVTAGEPLTLRISANSGGTSNSWESSQVQGGFPTDVCDTQVSVTAGSAQHTITLSAPVSSGTQTLTIRTFPGNTCSQSGTIGLYTAQLQVLNATKIVSVELQDPTTGQFVLLGDVAPPFLFAARGSSITARVTANIISGNPRWEATGVAFGEAPFDFPCNTSVSVHAVTFGAQHSFSFTVPSFATGDVDLRFGIFRQDFCSDGFQNFPLATSTYDNALNVGAISAVELLDPATSQWNPVGAVMPIITIPSGGTFSARLTLHADDPSGGGLESVYWSIRTPTQQVGAPVSDDCDNSVSVAPGSSSVLHAIDIPAPASPGTYDLFFGVLASDGCAFTNNQVMGRASLPGVLVIVTNTPPSLGGVPVSPQTVAELSLLTFTANANDAEAQALTFQLVGAPVGATIDPSTGQFNWTPGESQGPGIYTFSVQVSDGITSAARPLTIHVTEVNLPPALLNVPPLVTIPELSPYTFSAGATDADLPAQALAFSLNGAPVGASIHPTTGAFLWTPTEGQGPGTYQFDVRVNDGSVAATATVMIIVTDENDAPALGGVPATATTPELAPYTFDANATDADVPSQTLTFSIVGNLPAGANFNTATGVFAWTPGEGQGPAAYSFTVRVSDGSDFDEQSVTITVAEVNAAPVITVPPGFSAPWNAPISPTPASATDSDVPLNSHTFSLLVAPLGMTINPASGALSWTPGSGQLGANVVRVRVVDNGNPRASDEAQFTITVENRATTLTYNGAVAGQYSDKTWLSATLRDATTLAPIVGQVVTFTFNGGSAGSAVTDANGNARKLHQVLEGAGSYALAASTAAANGFEASSAAATFAVARENAIIVYDGSNAGAVPVSQTTYSIIVSVKEAQPEPDPSPDPDSRAAPGLISNAGLSAKLAGLSSSSNYMVNNCTPTGVSGTPPSYGASRNFVCTFTGPFSVDAYTIELSVNGIHYAGSADEAMTVYDPAAGNVSGGGTFMLGGDRVSFGISFTFTKGKTTPRGALVAIRHYSDGSRCRSKSNSLAAPAVNGTTTSWSGSGNYTCLDALGATTASAGNQTILGYMEDNATPGANADRFWVRGYGALFMPNTPSAAANAALLSSGNIQIPK